MTPSLTLHFHPLSSFCQKVLIGLYELDVPFRKHIVDLLDDKERAKFLALWPLGKFPVLRDDERDLTLPETTIILEYLDTRFAPGRLLPSEPELLRECRLRDRFFDLYVNVPMGQIVKDKLRPEDQRDGYGVSQARRQLETAYRIANDWMREAQWAAGDAFSLADCAAAPALFYANQIVPFESTAPHLAAYFARLVARPAFARVLAEARPYLAMFPG